MPLQAEAGFFSSVLGGEAYADTIVVEAVQSSQNSQTMVLLQANVSSASIFQDKDDQKSNKKDDQIDVNANVNIVFYNAIPQDAKLVVGDELMIPGGDMADEGGDKPASNLGSAPTRDKNYYDTHPIQNIAGYFINPLPTGRKTQGLHGPGNRGIDIGAPKGTPIYASAPGTVLIAKTGWSGGYGNMLIIQHPNGTKTLYAHMTKLGTRTGAEVSRGEIIGYVGSTGRSTGPHLHFEVFNARNPGADWSWTQQFYKTA